MRILLLIAAVVLVFWVARAIRAGIRNRQTDRPSYQVPSPEPMVQCAHCGIYLPASEALSDEQQALFCSEEHRRQHRAS